MVDKKIVIIIATIFYIVFGTVVAVYCGNQKWGVGAAVAHKSSRWRFLRPILNLFGFILRIFIIFFIIKAGSGIFINVEIYETFCKLYNEIVFFLDFDPYKKLESTFSFSSIFGRDFDQYDHNFKKTDIIEINENNYIKNLDKYGFGKRKLIIDDGSDTGIEISHQTLNTVSDGNSNVVSGIYVFDSIGGSVTKLTETDIKSENTGSVIFEIEQEIIIGDGDTYIIKEPTFMNKLLGDYGFIGGLFEKNYIKKLGLSMDWTSVIFKNLNLVFIIAYSLIVLGYMLNAFRYDQGGLRVWGVNGGSSVKLANNDLDVPRLAGKSNMGVSSLFIPNEILEIPIIGPFVNEIISIITPIMPNSINAFKIPPVKQAYSLRNYNWTSPNKKIKVGSFLGGTGLYGWFHDAPWGAIPSGNPKNKSALYIYTLMEFLMSFINFVIF